MYPMNDIYIYSLFDIHTIIIIKISNFTVLILSNTNKNKYDGSVHLFLYQYQCNSIPIKVIELNVYYLIVFYKNKSYHVKEVYIKK